MTLVTHLYVHDHADHLDLFDEAVALAGGAGPETDRTDEHPWWMADGERRLSTVPGSGLDAIVAVYYRPDGSLLAHDCDPDIAPSPEHRVDLSFDTAYTYRDRLGRSCTDLHACWIAHLGQWLDHRGLRWAWQNEMTGEVHAGSERYAALESFCSAGAADRSWFHHQIQPALNAARPTTTKGA